MKKRSLLVATIMLLVAVLLATGTTYAWFTSQSTAKATVSMEVAKGETLEIAAEGSDTYKFALTNTDLEITSNSLWQDYTYAEGDFVTKTYAVNEDTGVETWGKSTASDPVKVTIKFRSTASGDVVAKSSLAFNDTDNNNAYSKVLANARITVVDGNAAGATTHLATAAGTFNSADTVDTGITQDYSTVVGSTTGAVIKMTEGTSYYEGTATFYFWIDGVITSNTDIVDLADALVASLTFEQSN